MKKRVKISELKAHLSEYLRHMRRGHSVEVFDRETLIVEIVPVETRNGLEVRPATGSMRDFVPPPPLKTKVDVVALSRGPRFALNAYIDS